MARRTVLHDQIVKLIVGAGQASPAPPVGPALGSKGVKSMDFCKEFNARTANYRPGTPVPARVTVRPDRTFHFELRTPPTSTLLLIAANVSPIRGRLRGAGNTSGPNKQRSAAAVAAAAAITSGASVSKAAAAAGRAAAAAATTTATGGEGAANEQAISSDAGGAAGGTATSGSADAGGGDTDAATLAAATASASVTAAAGSGKAAAGGAGNSSLATVGQPVSLKHVFEIARIKQTETRLSGVPLEALARCVVAQAGSMGVVIVP